ncbi:serine/threonine-protein kinase PknH/PknJ [Mycobacterium sp. Z3061]|uniref:serine/threonine-protein kinase PknH/PknJ n=1 Tax=Mycobacterium sp. Z3061 TaxID=3073562 RepID=UPI002873B593|nr:serine/threonine-protein kinase PknH/PknJ [Mycobacterium sp. Z3061]
MDEVEFGRYRLRSVIGEGGMGKVYEAHDTMMDRDVAIKVLIPELATAPGYEMRFRREAHTAARLNEPHIIPVYESGEIDGRLYLVMPIIKGIDVAALLRRDGPMSPTRATHIIEQVAAALDAAHAAGLVHRDIKPSNALVTPRDFVYLIDFGIAHQTTATKLTGTGMIVGTWAYMAPERFTAGVADARSDVYALACLLHECLTGNSPYEGDSVEQQMAGHLMMDPPLLSQTRPGLPGGFDEVIARGMAKDPAERFQSAHELATAAQRALSTAPSRTSPILPTPPGEPTRSAGSSIPRPDYASAPTESMWQRDAPSDRVAIHQHRPGWAPAAQPRPPDRPPPGPVAGTLRPRRRAALISVTVAAVVVLTAGAVGIAVLLTRSRSSASQTSTGQSAAPSTPKVPPIAEAALEGLLLTPDQIGAAMGASGMTVTSSVTTLPGNGPASVSDQACVALTAAGSTAVYADSGWTAVRGQELKQPAYGPPLHDVIQLAVLFPSAQEADAFFTASAQRWVACSNRQLTITAPGTGLPDLVEVVGPVSNTNGTLSASLTSPAKAGINCQRALAVASNVAVDVQACNASPSDAVAASIAHQIATKALRSQ